jgi:hypothetical protein
MRVEPCKSTSAKDPTPTPAGAFSSELRSPLRKALVGLVCRNAMVMRTICPKVLDRTTEPSEPSTNVNHCPVPAGLAVKNSPSA